MEINIALNYYVSEDDDGDSLVPGSEGTINFGNNSGVTEVSRSVALADMTGFRYLVINPTNIRDTKGRVYSEKTVSGALKLDNTPPVINSVRMHPDFNGTSIWINFTDQESGIKNFTYIFPDREETRTKPLEGKLNSPTYANLFLSEKFTTTGLNEKIRIRAYDNAGNEKVIVDAKTQFQFGTASFVVFVDNFLRNQKTKWKTIFALVKNDNYL